MKSRIRIKMINSIDDQQQKRAGYTLLMGAILIVTTGVFTFRYYNVPTIGYFGLLIPVFILLFFGYRNISASNSGVAITDERRKNVATKAGNYAVWLLLAVIVLDAFLQITPEEGVRTIYMAVGILAYGIGLIFARYLDPIIYDDG